MARSLAILLMLEGHFTGAALANQYRDHSNLIFETWYFIHGLTSPLFFTVTGLVFVYLLTAEKSPSVRFWQNDRVKKGFKRVWDLIFWGYFIQINLIGMVKALYYRIPLKTDWLSAFHVLQSIGVGIFFLMLTYGLYSLIKKGKIHFYFLAMALVILGFYIKMASYIQWDEIANPNHPNYWPMHFPRFIQNLFYGPFSDFSFLRYGSYVLLGGTVGSIIRVYESKTREWWFALIFIGVGLSLTFLIPFLFGVIDSALVTMKILKYTFLYLGQNTLSRFGQVLVMLGILMLIDARFNVKAKLFLKLGQNTFPIYVVHVIFLYGGIFGVGLKTYFADAQGNPMLNPYAAIAVSLGAIGFFTLMVYYMEPLAKLYERTLGRIRIFGKRK
jgi:hypothetical protein